MHKFGYTMESLQEDKIMKLENDLNAHKKLTNITIDNLEKHINQNVDLDNLKEIYFVPEESSAGEGVEKVLVNAKWFLDINKRVVDHEVNQRFLEQDYKNKLSEHRKEIITEAVRIIEDKQRTDGRDFQKSLTQQLDKCKQKAVRETIQTLYDKGLFDSYDNKDQMFEKYLNFTDEYLLEKYGKEIKVSEDEIYYISDLKYSVREDIVARLRELGFKDVVDMRHRMKLTGTEINFMNFIF